MYWVTHCITTYALVKAPVQVLYGKYSMRGGVENLIQHMSMQTLCTPSAIFVSTARAKLVL